MMNEGDFKDNKTLHYKDIYTKSANIFNDFLTQTSKENYQDGHIIEYQKKHDLLEEQVWNATSRLYKHLVREYRSFSQESGTGTSVGPG
jgi:hypothetical protein